MAQHDTGRIKVVTGTGVSLALAAVTVASASGAQAAEQHTVRKGETVSHIAARSGVSVATIAEANGLTDPGRIYAGQVLVIPSGPTSDKPARAKQRATVANVTHTVSSGDTVSHLATRYGTSVKAIVEANGLDSRAFIVVGQRLTIPGASATEVEQGRSTTAKTSSSTTHTVVAGDTVSRIASRHGVSVASIVKANGLDLRAFIVVGQKLTIPGATEDSSELPDGEKVPDTFAGRTYPKHVVDSANKNKAALLAAGVPSRATMQATVVATAKKLGVSSALAQAVAFQESGFNHASVSPANAIGTMQVIPTSGDWAETLVGHSINLLDPDDNVTAGVAILRQLVTSAPDLDTAIAGYYQGATSVRKYGMFSDTRRYVANVRTLMEQFA